MRLELEDREQKNLLKFMNILYSEAVFDYTAKLDLSVICVNGTRQMVDKSIINSFKTIIKKLEGDV